ncbi:MAG: hypothetical protein ACRCZB_04775 [Bacteroidales bacterium]
MKTQEFLTEEFYLSEFTTRDVFNKLIKNKLVADKDMYSSGEFLFMEVIDNEKSREILAPVISNLKEYKEFNESHLVCDSKCVIDMSMLQELHYRHFGRDSEIMWDNENEEFELRCALENEDEE